MNYTATITKDKENANTTLTQEFYEQMVEWGMIKPERESHWSQQLKENYMFWGIYPGRELKESEEK